MHTYVTLLADLRQLGIVEGDVLLVHSSFKSIGPVDGGAQTVVQALTDAVGKSGTLLMPSFSAGSEYDLAKQGFCFDVRSTKSDCGYLTDYFRQLPDVRRSLSPTHSLSARGAAAEELLAGHEKCTVTAGKGSPFQRIIEHHGKILLLGVSRERNTTMHYIENTGGAPTISPEQFSTWVIDASGKKYETRIFPHVKGAPRNYTRAVELLQAANGVVSGLFGEAHCEVCDAALLDEICRKELKANPRAFLKM